MCVKAFIDDNSESIIDFNIDPQFNRLTCKTNNSIKQIVGENNRVLYDSNKMNNDNNDNNNGEQRNDADIDFALIQMKELIENVKNLQTTHQDVVNTSDTLQSKDTEIKCDKLLYNLHIRISCWNSRTTQSQHERKEPLSSVTLYYPALRSQTCRRKG